MTGAELPGQYLTDLTDFLTVLVEYRDEIDHDSVESKLADLLDLPGWRMDWSTEEVSALDAAFEQLARLRAAAGGPLGGSGQETGDVIRLWRAAPAEGAYFGRGSYWTHREAFACQYRTVLADNVGGEFVVYRADVELTDVRDFPIEKLLDSAKVNRFGVPQYAEDGYRWLTYYEAMWEGVLDKQYVFLGTEPIAAERAP